MDIHASMLERNARFAVTDFDPALKIMPSTGTIVVGCADPRVDPAAVLGLKQGEAAVIRNVGGRVDKWLLETLAILRVVATAAGQAEGKQGPGPRNLVLLHHTDCGIIGCYRHAPELLARHMGVDVAALEALAITDPRGSVALDVARLRAEAALPDTAVVSGLVYDVATGRVEVVVEPSPLRGQAG